MLPEDDFSDRQICSVEQAVEISLPRESHQNHRSLWNLARALLNVQEHLRATGRLLPGEPFPPALRHEAFDLWHTNARSFLRPEESRDDYFIEFLEACVYARTPCGESRMDEILEKCQKLSPPEIAVRNFSDASKILFITFCRELQRKHGREPFFLSCREVQRLFHLKSHTAGARWLNAAVSLGILKPIEKGKLDGRKATTFHYLLPFDHIERVPTHKAKRASEIEEALWQH